MTEARKSNSPLVLGFQGRSQLAKRYGLDAEAMLSQPATKIFPRTSEPEAARWIAQTLGDVETERIRQSRSARDSWAALGRGSMNDALERQVEPLVLPSEITGLPNLRGYLKFGNLVTPLIVPYVHRVTRQPAWLPRADSASAGTPRVTVPAVSDQRTSSGRPATPASHEPGVARQNHLTFE
jgi:hypothetical protein